MLTYDFTKTGSDSLYIYLYKCIKNDIISGKIACEQKLPSKRSFAKNLGISVITVENAYEQLISEGYIYSVPKKGFFVCDLKKTEMSDYFRINEKSEAFNKEDLVDNNDYGIEMCEREYIADFSSNQTDSEVFPFSSWSKSVKKVLNTNRIQLMTNPPCGGIMELRERIAEYLQQFRGIYVNPKQIIIGAGTEYLYTLLIQLLGNDLKYAVENPGYNKIAKIYSNMNVKYEYIDIDDAGVVTDDLEKKQIDIVHISPSHHFPTGIVMPISRRYELLGWALKKNNRYIIEDDYDSELRLTGKPVPSMYGIDVSERVIYINTFTKTLASTVRISYMVLPEHMADKFYRKLSFYSCTVSNFEQYTLADFIRNGSFEKHINRLRTYYSNKRDIIIDKIAQSSLGSIAQITKEEAGIHFLMQIMTEKSEDEIVRLAKQEGIKLMPIRLYYAHEVQNTKENIRSENKFVMNYASINVDCVEKVAEILYNISK